MRIAPELYQELIEHAQAEAPNECCGMIATREGEAVRVIRARNAAESPLRYEIDGAEQLKIYNEIEDAGLDLGAIYHSHTHTEPYPSQTDINFAANWPGLEWVIIGLAGGEPEVRCYVIDGGEVREVELELEVS